MDTLGHQRGSTGDSGGLDAASVRVPLLQGCERCLSCEYDLKSLPDGLCPECGAPFTHAQLRDAAMQRAGRFGRWVRVLVVRFGTCILAAMAFVAVAALCAMAALYSIPLTAAATVGASLLGAVIDQCLSFDREQPTPARAKIESLVVCVISICVVVSIGTVSAPFVACVLTTALCQLWRARNRNRVSLMAAMPSVWLLVLSLWIVLPAQSRIMRGFRFSDWDMRSASIKFRTEAMPAVEARTQGFIVGAAGLAALLPWYARLAWVRARRVKRDSESTARSPDTGA